MLAPRSSLEFYTRVFLCFACFASQTPGLCSAFPSAPFEFVRLFVRFIMRTLLHKHRVCAGLFSRFTFKKFVLLCLSRFVMRNFSHKHRSPLKFVRLSLSCYVMRTSRHKHQFCAVLYSRLPFKFTRLYWSCFVVRVFRFTWFCDIRLVNASYVVVAACFYSPGFACFMYLILCFNICRFAISCVICFQFGVLLFPSLSLL